MGCALVVMALVVGCQSEEQVSENSVKEEVREDGFDEIAFMNKVKFKSLVDEHPDKRAPSATVNPKDLKFLNLVSVKLARKKLDCKSGFGSEKYDCEGSRKSYIPRRIFGRVKGGYVEFPLLYGAVVG